MPRKMGQSKCAQMPYLATVFVGQDTQVKDVMYNIGKRDDMC